MLVELGGDVSIMCLTGPCIGCHVARQLRQRRHGTGGQAGVTVCPKRSPRQHGVQIGEALLRGGQPRGDPILCVGRREIVCSPLSNPPHAGQQKIRWRLTTAERRVDTEERITTVCVNVCIIQTSLCLFHPFSSRLYRQCTRQQCAS